MPNRARNSGHVDVCGVVFQGSAGLYGVPTPAQLPYELSRAGVLACLRVDVGMGLSPFAGQFVFCIFKRLTPVCRPHETFGYDASFL
eukprot:9469669-Pyramimonas_sp.AAC.1